MTTNEKREPPLSVGIDITIELRRDFPGVHLTPKATVWLANRIAEAVNVARTERESETLGTIARWCEETFGPIEPERIAGRAAEEMAELVAEPDKVEEAADVVICLSRYPDLWPTIVRKMEKNRRRKWRLMGDGTGYHIKDVDDPPPSP